MRRFLSNLCLGAALAIGGMVAMNGAANAQTLAFNGGTNGAQTQSVDIPKTLSYQGLITAKDGTPVKDGDYAITVTLYGDKDGQTSVWKGTYTTHVANGVFSVLLGSGDQPLPAAVNMDGQLFAGVTFNGEQMASLTPISSVPFAMNVADGAITSKKMGTDYVGSVTVNGQVMSGRGTNLNIVTDGMDATVDPMTNTVLLRGINSAISTKGSGSESNTTISGTLTVTGNTYLNADTYFGSSGGGHKGLLVLYPGSNANDVIVQTGSVALPNSGYSAVRNYYLKDVGVNANFLFDNSIGGQTVAGGLTVNGGLTLGAALNVPNGGTGQSTLTNHSVLVGAGTSAITQVGPGATNTLLHGAGASADPSFSAVVNGDLASGAYSNITGLGTQSQALNMGGFKITNMADPTNPQDAVTQAWFLAHISNGSFVVYDNNDGAGNMLAQTELSTANTKFNGVSLVKDWGNVDQDGTGNAADGDFLHFVSQNLGGTPNGGATVAISAISESAGLNGTNGIVTVTTTGNHNFGFGQTVTIAGVTDPAYDGTFTIATIPSTNQFTYYLNGYSAEASSSSGTAAVAQAAYGLKWDAQGTIWTVGANIDNLSPYTPGNDILVSAGNLHLEGGFGGSGSYNLLDEGSLVIGQGFQDASIQNNLADQRGRAYWNDAVANVNTVTNPYHTVLVEGPTNTGGTAAIQILQGNTNGNISVGGIGNGTTLNSTLRWDNTGANNAGDYATANSGGGGRFVENTNYLVDPSGDVTSGTWNGSVITPTYGGTGVSNPTAHDLLIAEGSSNMTPISLGAGQLLIGTTSSDPVAATLTGTSNRLAVTSASGSVTLNIDPAYVGQTTITTLGTVGTGTWQGTTITPTYGGTGVSNPTAHDVLIAEGSSNMTPISLGAGQLLIGTTSSDPVAATLTGTSNRLAVTSASGSVTLNIDPAYVGQTTITTLGTVGTGTWQGTTVGSTYGGTGVSNPTAHSVIVGEGSSAVAQVTGSSNQVLHSNTGGDPTFAAIGVADMTPGGNNTFLTTNNSGVVGWNGLNVDGVTLTGDGSNASLAIKSTYVGQTSITTLGTIGTGTWNATTITPTYGGTGVSNPTAHDLLIAEGSSNMTPISLGAGQLLIGTTSSDPVAATLTGTSNRLAVTSASGSVTLNIDPAYVGQTTITTLGTVGTGTWQGTTVGSTYGGTGVSNPTAHSVLIGEGSSAVAQVTGGANTVLHGSAGDPSFSAIVNGDITNGTIQNAKLANSTIGITSSSSSINVTSSPISLGSSGNVDLNMANTNTWTANQIFDGTIQAGDATHWGTIAMYDNAHNHYINLSSAATLTGTGNPVYIPDPGNSGANVILEHLSAGGAQNIQTLTLSNPLQLSSGGTGNGTVGALGAVAYSNGSTAYSFSNAPTSGYILVANGSTPTWTAMSGDATISNTGVVSVSHASSASNATSATSAGTASNLNSSNLTGDVTNSGDNVTVTGLDTYPIDFTTPPTNGQLLKYNGSHWVPSSSGAGVGFDAITSGTNTGNTMHVGTGSTLDDNSGAGTINATSAKNLSGTNLTGDVSNSGNSVTVNTVGTSTAANIHSAELAANAATSSNTPSTIVKRDGSGNFSANTITAALSGNATTATTAANLSGTNLTGDVSNSGNSVTVNTVGTSTAANIHSAELAANAATSSNTPSTIVKRDGSGNFSANTITAALSGNASTATTAGNVTGVVAVANGGTGDNSMVAYAVVAGGTTSTGPLQQVSGLGTSGQVLTSNGAGSLPSWAPVSAGSVNFSGILSGTNSTATMTVASGATLTYSSGEIDASKVGTTSTSANASYYPLFAASSTNSNQAVNLNSGLNYNPSTNTLTATTFSGSLSGNASTATSSTNATNATNVGTNSVSTNATYYPTFVSATSGNNPIDVNSGLNYNPSTGTLTATTFNGNTTSTTVSSDQLLSGVSTAAQSLTGTNPYTSTTVATYAGNVDVQNTSGVGYGTVNVVINNSRVTANSVIIATCERTSNSASGIEYIANLHEGSRVVGTSFQIDVQRKTTASVGNNEGFRIDYIIIN